VKVFLSKIVVSSHESCESVVEVIVHDDIQRDDIEVGSE